MSLGIILFIAASIDYDLFLRDITQTYTQSKIFLNRKFFIRSSPELKLSNNSILKVIKPFDDVSEIDAY